MSEHIDEEATVRAVAERVLRAIGAMPWDDDPCRWTIDRGVGHVTVDLREIFPHLRSEQTPAVTRSARQEIAS